MYGLCYLKEGLIGLKTSEASHASAHAVHFIKYKDKHGNERSVVYKENKHGKPDASINEAAFSEIAKLYMGYGLTPGTHIVKEDSGEVTGIAIDNMADVIVKREGPGAQYFVCNDYTNAEDIRFVKSKEQAPFKFLNKLPHGFIHKLLQAHRNPNNHISIDMDSLASILCTPYFLEEDDLHRANIGFYIAKRNGKPKVVFFNIDHDLLFCESIMSRMDSRFSNWLLNDDAFKISRRDLINFPDLKYSHNHFWPTRKRFMVKYGDDKVYSSSLDREAFRNLKYSPEFKRAKWRHFLKFLVMPDAAVSVALRQHLDTSDPEQLARFNMIRQAMQERSSKLRATLFSIQEFRDYFLKYGQQDIAAIQADTMRYLDETCCKIDTRANLKDALDFNAANYLKLCKSAKKNKKYLGDTPLHMAIRLNEYRFDETHKSFSRCWHRKNAQGETPMDLAVKKALKYKPNSQIANPSYDPISVVRNLIHYGAKLTAKQRQQLAEKGIKLKGYQFNGYYFKRTVKNYSHLKDILIDISGDVHLSLKVKKMMTAQLVNKHISKLSYEDLKEFKTDLNGSKWRTKAPELKYISQLRSKFWLIRKLRGLYGGSSTKVNLNRMIHKAINNVKKNQSLESHKFFAKNNRKPSLEQNDLELSQFCS